jgi:endo-1,4-beta-xylanase
VAPLDPAGDRYAGVAVRGNLLDDDGYAQLIARAFQAVTPENEMKWERVAPERHTFDFAAADRIVNFARSRGKRVRGHTLVWHMQNAAWLENGRFSRDELISIMREHIRMVMGHFRGRVQEWDVVNEAVDDQGHLRDSVWLRGVGPEYIAMAFRFAREADRGARLFYNDYGAEGAGLKSRAVLALVRGLKRRGVPIDGVGLQGHVSLEPIPRYEETLRAFAAAGLDVVLTEVDVRLPDDKPDYEAQASQYAKLARGCVRLPACKGFVVWGLDDRDSWVPQAYPGESRGTLFDGDLEPKPAYDALRRALADPRGRRAG